MALNNPKVHSLGIFKIKFTVLIVVLSELDYKSKEGQIAREWRTDCCDKEMLLPAILLAKTAGGGGGHEKAFERLWVRRALELWKCVTNVFGRIVSRDVETEANVQPFPKLNQCHSDEKAHQCRRKASLLLLLLLLCN